MAGFARRTLFVAFTAARLVSSEDLAEPPAPPPEVPAKQVCKDETIATLTANNVNYRLGTWEYGQIDQVDMPGGPLPCIASCESDVECMHWVFDCHKRSCRRYNDGGYEEEGDPQFGWDFLFLGDSTHNDRRLKALAAEKPGEL
eukprot:TRINITY_DN44188_c0_g1_i1.p1 TRINITY_DN44188_c0_g1~~TRINITY_DN44188_c0_g1_i1.p1  ORF type:complete len:151 (-),score=29.23 TRINITY_DN44188_c0_g1_i1:155-586(-)